jgi:hypothetical protein
VDHDQVVECAQEQQVVQRGRAALGFWDDVVRVAVEGLSPASGGGAVLVAQDQRAAQAGRDGGGVRR